jgi:hypothetical protein
LVVDGLEAVGSFVQHRIGVVESLILFAARRRAFPTGDEGKSESEQAGDPFHSRLNNEKGRATEAARPDFKRRDA